MADKSDPPVLGATANGQMLELSSKRTANAPGRRRRLTVVGLATLALILIAGAVKANLMLSSEYSPGQAVLDYFAALRQRNANETLANANFLRGDGSYDAFFGKAAVHGMLNVPANSDIKNLRITSDRVDDDSSHAITVSMVWGGKRLMETLAVRKDSSRSHFLVYQGWRVQIPATTIHVALPNQAGVVLVDGIAVPPENRTSIVVIQGFHQVTMFENQFYNTDMQTVDGTDPSVTVAMNGVVSARAQQLASDAVKGAATLCDAARTNDCFEHTYTAPDHSVIYYLTLPGYGNVDYNSYVVSLASDPTVGMRLMILADTEKVSVSGSCAEKVVIDGSRQYSFKGDYTGTLTWNGVGFTADGLMWDCHNRKA